MTRPVEERFTPEQIQAAREHSADYERRLIESITTGPDKKYGTNAWVRKLEESIEQTLRGEHDGNFTVRQRMLYFLTGKCVGLLEGR